ncbi:MAG: carbohydrate-binding protein, partial [Opitutaceae bacterium]|nr:carbohydrate-binding protein [Cytophagales bacterium]
KNSYTIHPGIIEFKGQNYLFYHNATLTLNGQGPALGRRSVCVEYLCYNADGTIKPIIQTVAGITVASPCPPSPVVQSPFKTNPWPIPGRIEAEDYDIGGEGVAFHEANASGNQGLATYRNDEVDIETTKDVDGSYNLSYVLNIEWVEYSVNVSAAGKYDLSLRVATDAAGKTMHAEIDGQNITGAITIPNTGGYQTWQTVTVPNLSLTIGKHTLRLAFDADYFNLNYVRFDKSTVTSIQDETDGATTDRAYPNPFENTITLNFKSVYSYKIVDLSGKLLLHGVASGPSEVGGDLQPGIYLLQVISEEKNYVSKINKK